MPRRVRGNSGRLLLGSKKPGTVKKYLREVRGFLAWAVHWEETAVDAKDLDELLVDYFHELLDKGYGPHKAVCCYYGLVMLAPSIKNRLPIAKQALKGYQCLSSVAYPPMKRQLVHLVAVDLHQRGRSDMALAVLVGFEALLRIGEVVGLHVADTVDAEDDRLPLGVRLEGFSLRLRVTKTGSEQWARIEDPFVSRLLRARIAGMQKRSTAKLFSFSASQLRRAFKQSCKRVGLGDEYVVHSLRHGRATVRSSTCWRHPARSSQFMVLHTRK